MVILLKANGGGVIEVNNRRIEVTVSDDGWSARYGIARNGSSLEEAQQQLTKMLIKQ